VGLCEAKAKLPVIDPCMLAERHPQEAERLAGGSFRAIGHALMARAADIDCSYAAHRAIEREREVAGWKARIAYCQEANAKDLSFDANAKELDGQIAH
jgi:hypothetical protein